MCGWRDVCGRKDVAGMGVLFRKGTLLLSPIIDIHILSGSFTSFSLFLLAFSPLNRSLRLLRTVPVVGPHQDIAQTPQPVYATTWAVPPTLHVWTLPSLAHIDSTPITATSSCITILDSRAYSMGGPTGEIHVLDPATRDKRFRSSNPESWMTRMVDNGSELL
ncbi:hypothetical protein ARMGADRAFT_1065390 [Armillaria gallica]|uniref:Uncharacterized protein n=1 Tax=Armillaria gallica TaxID=47427 RepID=A0A2H3DLJ2_ARMGA|nr:hypothetical protein ARMGADRAFT_1065390 [Armillaria gallica]